MSETVADRERRPVAYVCSDGVATVTITAPPANPFSISTIEGLDAAIARAIDEEARVVVFASGLPGFFIAGADIGLFGEGDVDAFSTYLDQLRAMIESIPAAPFLSIAAIDGHALGGGLEFSLACTLRVVGAGARLGVPEIKLGLLPGAGGTQRLPRAIGRGAAVDLLLTGRSVGPEEALSLGLAERAGDDALQVATTWARELSVGPIDAYRETMRCVEASYGDLDDGLRIEADALHRLYLTPDGREGIAAFLEKRAPRFQEPPE